MAPKRGWHQDALDRAHEATATLKADQQAALQGAAEHLKSVTSPQSEASEQGG